MALSSFLFQGMYDDISMELFWKSLKPIQAAPQRWTGIVKPARRLLETWPSIGPPLLAHKNKMVEKYGQHHKYVKPAQEKLDAYSRLRRNRQTFMEHLAMLEAIHTVVADAQYLDVPSVANSHMLMIQHRLTTFNRQAPLSVLHHNEDGK